MYTLDVVTLQNNQDIPRFFYNNTNDWKTINLRFDFNFMDYLLTLIPIVFILIAGVSNTKKETEVTLFGKQYTDVLKCLCCIIVVMVHFPTSYQNPLQDMIGSFAYVCVTLFFMISSYGMQFSSDKKPDYLKNFWRNRLVSLLIPCAIINIITYIASRLIKGSDASIETLWFINSYVLILLEYCLWFYCIKLIARIFKITNKWIVDGLLILGVVASSLYLYLPSDGGDNEPLGWCYERYGLIWGIILYRFMPQIKTWLTQNRRSKLILFLVLTMMLGLAYLKYKTVYFYGEYLLKIVLGFAIIVFLLLVTIGREYKNRIVIYIGSISYEIYLLHVIVIGNLMELAPNLSSGKFIIITYAVTVIMAALVHWLSKRLVGCLRSK